MIKLLIFNISLVLLVSCTQEPTEYSTAAMVKISSNGRYVLSSHHGRTLWLWDVREKSKTKIADDVNIFSPYFVDGTDIFLWQELSTNLIHVQKTDGTEIKTIKLEYPVYEHAMEKSLTSYVASNQDLSIYHYKNGNKVTLKIGLKDYLYVGKLANLSLHNGLLLSTLDCDLKGEDWPLEYGLLSTDRYPKTKLVFSTMKCITLYSLKQRKAIRKYVGPAAKTTGDLSPDAQYVVAGDEGGRTYQWNVNTNKRIKLDWPTNPEWLKSCWINEECAKRIKHELATKKKMPKDFYERNSVSAPYNVAIKFIDEQGDFIRFVVNIDYGVLYNVSSPEIIEYLHLGKMPYADTSSVFVSANTIDTAPKVNMLVMGQRPLGYKSLDKGTGIIVYKFDPKTKKLKRIWAPDGPGPHYRDD